jgi:hypothetical protein
MGGKKRSAKGADDIERGPGIHAPESDETVEGGKFQNADGEWINAAGKRIHEDGTELTDEEVEEENASKGAAEPE